MNPVIIHGARTPVTAMGRAQGQVPGYRLVSSVLGALDFQPDLVVMGTAVTPGGNPARVAALDTGRGQQVPGITVDAQCGSGLVSVIQGAQHAQLCDHTVIAGGFESVSTVPQASQQAVFVPQGQPDPNMTVAADQLAQRLDISRQRQEQFAIGSHQKYLAHQRLHRELLTTGEIIDDGPRNISPAIARRFTAVQGCSTVTGLTAARVVDGAAGVVIVPGDHPRATSGLEILGHVLIGGDPQQPAMVPAQAVTQLLGQLNLGLDDFPVIEIVEAYAAQVLALTQSLGLSDTDPRINAVGGALALGHPWGASGTIALLNAMIRLQNHTPGTKALIGCAVAGGMGVAMVVEKR